MIIQIILYQRMMAACDHETPVIELMLVFKANVPTFIMQDHL